MKARRADDQGSLMTPEFKSTLKRRTLEISAILLVTTVSAIVIYYAVRPLDAVACRGRTQSEIIARLGPPSTRSSGNYGAPPVTLVAGRSHVETLLWERMIGTIYLSTSDESRTRVCFSADWLPHGAAF